MDPYRIWVSEIMLQQTRVEAVKNFYESWMKKWPRVKDLAKAKESEVLNAWKGLGYYSRAKNILKSARIIMKDYDGIVPENLKELMDLPGIGRYTAGAIASIAYQKKISIVDGNVARVYARIFLMNDIVNEPKGLKVYYELADQLLPTSKLPAFNQGLMELGAMVCTPSKPNCLECPVNKFCKSHLEGQVDNYPKRKKKPKTEQLYRIAFVVLKHHKFYLEKQNKKGRYQGMWEFPGVQLDGLDRSHAVIQEHAEELFDCEGILGQKLMSLSHTFTRYKQSIDVYSFTPDNKSIKLPGSWFALNQIKELPMGSAQLKILAAIDKHEKEG